MTIPGPLVTTDWLADHLGDVAVVDVRWYLSDVDQGRREYADGHIPGAVFLDLETDLSGTTGSGRHPLPTAEEFAAVMRRVGIGAATPVVAYDQNIGAVAARLWWLLRHFGHDQAAVLDGGFALWERNGFPVEAAEQRRMTASVAGDDFSPRARTDDVIDRDCLVDGFTGRLLDARAPERYRGEIEPVDARPGHIPGAENLPFTTLAVSGTLASPDQLSSLLGETKDAVVYCGSGVTACHLVLAAAVAGRPLPRLYDGSWSDWAATDLPAAVGAAP